MTKKEEVSISLRYIEKELYEKIDYILKAKGFNIKTKAAKVEYALQDYVNMMELGAVNNPYLIQSIEQIIRSSNEQTERNLGGRLTKLVMELAIQTGITNRLINDYFAKFDGDPEEVERMLSRYREAVVLDLQQKKKPFTYKDLISEEE